MEKYCRLCTRYFYGEAAGKVKDDVCVHCLDAMVKLQASIPIELGREELEELVSKRKRAQLEGLSPEGWRKAIREADLRDKEV